jgi:chemotaxis protein MotC
MVRAENASHGRDLIADVLAQGDAGDAAHGAAEVISVAAKGHAEQGHAAETPAAELHTAESPAGQSHAAEPHTAPAHGDEEKGAHEDEGESAHSVPEEPDPEDIERDAAIDDYIRAISPGPAGVDGETKGLQPYQLVRSLQFVQDSVVQGDHSAMEMQRYLLGVIDERLRKADQSVFDNPRNVDAALVYAMSGGNPETLDLLATKDKFGNFDNEITTVLRAYLDGTAVRTQTSLEDILKIHTDTRVGPYLALIAANVKAGLNEDGALEMFDAARLGAPGTIIEESALRRSLFVATKKGRIDKAIDYAILYARRFINSPYAGQYADQLVELGTDNIEQLGTDRLQQILAFMDQKRQREVYLRISRKAAIGGQTELALLAAEEAKKLSDPSDPAPAALAGLYSGLASVPSDDVVEVDRSLDELEKLPLSPRDAALRDAARIIANEIIREPDPNSLTQAFSPTMEGQTDEETPSEPAVAAPSGQDLAGQAIPEPTAPGEASTETADAAGAMDDGFRDYVDGQNKLIDEIDGLLAGNDGVE